MRGGTVGNKDEGARTCRPGGHGSMAYLAAACAQAWAARVEAVPSRTALFLLVFLTGPFQALFLSLPLEC